MTIEHKPDDVTGRRAHARHRRRAQRAEQGCRPQARRVVGVTADHLGSEAERAESGTAERRQRDFGLRLQCLPIRRLPRAQRRLRLGRLRERHVDGSDPLMQRGASCELELGERPERALGYLADRDAFGCHRAEPKGRICRRAADQRVDLLDRLLRLQSAGRDNHHRRESVPTWMVFRRVA
jgi:hypothetical protein